jgi:hypothetical protein
MIISYLKHTFPKVSKGVNGVSPGSFQCLPCSNEQSNVYLLDTHTLLVYTTRTSTTSLAYYFHAVKHIRGSIVHELGIFTPQSKSDSVAVTAEYVGDPRRRART